VSFKWSSPPPVVVLSGAFEYLRIREFKKAVLGAERSGRDIHEIVDGETATEEIEGVLNSGVFFKGTTLVVVRDPEKIDYETLKEHHSRGDNTTSVLLYLEGDIKAKSPLGKLVGILPDKVVAQFKVPPPWEMEETAVQFLIEEARVNKLRLEPKLAMAVVRDVGMDLGILHFEMDKIARLMASSDSREITPVHVKSVVSGFSELGAFPIVTALGNRDLRGLSQALANMKRTHSGAPAGATLKTCALLNYSVSSWLHVASLLAAGADHAEIAQRTKSNEFALRKNVLPIARKWSEESLVELLRALARVERGVKVGHGSPWVELECVLFSALST